MMLQAQMHMMGALCDQVTQQVRKMKGPGEDSTSGSGSDSESSSADSSSMDEETPDPNAEDTIIALVDNNKKLLEM